MYCLMDGEGRRWNVKIVLFRYTFIQRVSLRRSLFWMDIRHVKIKPINNALPIYSGSPAILKRKTQNMWMKHPQDVIQPTNFPIPRLSLIPAIASTCANVVVGTSQQPALFVEELPRVRIRRSRAGASTFWYSFSITL